MIIKMKQLNKNRLERNFLITFIIVTIATIIFSSAVITAFFDKKMTEREFEVQQQSLQISQNSLDQLDAEAKQLLVLFGNLKTVKNLFYNGVAENELKSYIISLSESHILLENSPNVVVYLIDYNRSRVYTVYYNEYMYSFDNFFDQEMLHTIRQASTEDKFKPTFRTVDYPDYTHNKEVVSYYYFEGAELNFSNTAIVVNIDKRWLENQFAVECAPGESVFLYDTKSNEVLCKNTGASEKIAQAGLGATLKHGHREKDKITFSVAEKKKQRYLLSYQSLNQSNLMIAKATDYHNIQSALLRVRFITGVIIAFLLILGIIAAWSISNRLFHKVDRELKKKYHHQVNSLSLREIYHGISTVDYMEDSSVKKLADEFAAAHHIEPQTKLFLALFALDYPPKERDSATDGIHIVKYEITKLLSAYLKIFVGSVIKNDMMLIILQAPEPESDAVQILRETVDAVRHKFDISLSAYYSTFGTVSGLTSMIFDVKVLRESKFIFNPASVLSTSAADMLEENDADIPMALSEKLSLLIYSEQYQQLYETINQQLFEKRWEYSVQSIREALMMVSNTLQSALYHKQKKQMVNYNNLIKEINSLPKQPNIAEAQKMLKHITEQLSLPHDSENTAGQNKQQEYVDKICRIVKENYQDLNFSSKTIADTLNLSNIYICRIFKNAKEESLNQYINTYRIEKAAELLRTTSLSAQEISKRCGFYNANYFYTLFKKHMEVTASEYQKAHHRSER